MKVNEFINHIVNMIGGFENISNSVCDNQKIFITLKDSSVINSDKLNHVEGIDEIKYNRNRIVIKMKENYLEDLIMDKNKTIAEQVLAKVGGKENVNDVTHCMTRLRLILKDESIINDDEVKTINGVISIVKNGGEYQIVIGQNVSKVYTYFCELGKFSQNEKSLKNIDDAKEKLTVKSVFNNIIGYISGSMVGILPIILCAALIKSIASILGPDLLGWVAADSDFVVLCNMVYSAGFYFFPIYIGYTAAKRLNTSIPLAMMLGGLLLCPTFVEMANAGGAISVYGIPAMAYNYSQTVIPMLMIVYVLSIVYKFVSKFMPNALNATITPVITILIMLPITLCLLAPIGNFLGVYIADFMYWIYNTFGFIGVGVMAALYMPLVITGMHNPVCAIAWLQLSTQGSEPFIFVAGTIAGLALIAMDTAIYLRLKNKQEKANVFGALMSIIASNVAEPTLYGVALPHKKSFLMMMIGSFLGGCYLGLFKCKLYSAILVFPLNILQFSGPDSTEFMHAVIGCAIAMASTFILTFLFGLSKKEIEE